MPRIPTTEQRVDALMALSDRVYPVIDQTVDNETRARHMLRLGINVVAQTLEDSFGIRHAGNVWHGLMVRELQAGGLSIHDPEYDAWPEYRRQVTKLSISRVAPDYDPSLDVIAQKYADVRRATWAQDGTLETDASHVSHLGSLALPYAAQYYPELDPAKLALYYLVHDIPEYLNGDVASLGMSKAVEAQKDRDEAEAIEELRTTFGPSFPKLIQIIDNYEALVDDESKYIKTFDKLDPGFTHFSNNGYQLTSRYGLTSREAHHAIDASTIKRMERYNSEFPLVMEDRQELTHRVSVATWPETNDPQITK
jgi:5'-deoxynucleotidase YfbR-like HD superfamily hydrolase